LKTSIIAVRLLLVKRKAGNSKLFHQNLNAYILHRHCHGIFGRNPTWLITKKVTVIYLPVSIKWLALDATGLLPIWGNNDGEISGKFTAINVYDDLAGVALRKI
jgi:hypothetical protein